MNVRTFMSYMRNNPTEFNLLECHLLGVGREWVDLLGLYRHNEKESRDYYIIVIGYTLGV